ncbi:putative mitochondrial protein AtMg00310 [Castanea sativa]|uniref:putative mitochondrial protein AtMg00310 n=1 Tax=Castanea sativa TaxID=21020 RepID=UPI003F64A924
MRWNQLCDPKAKGGVGFRDINAFNLEILAKQAWCLIHHQHSLMYRVYKAHYFPTCSFLEANLGSNPSYVWRSLLQTRDIILEGSVWKVGDGATIEIENHQWLPKLPCFLRDGSRPRMVGELVYEVARQWDREKIAYWFEPHTCSDILRITLNNMHAKDALTWKEDKSKLFIVKRRTRLR